MPSDVPLVMIKSHFATQHNFCIGGIRDTQQICKETVAKGMAFEICRHARMRNAQIANRSVELCRCKIFMICAVFQADQVVRVNKSYVIAICHVDSCVSGHRYTRIFLVQKGYVWIINRKCFRIEAMQSEKPKKQKILNSNKNKYDIDKIYNYQKEEYKNIIIVKHL